MFGRASGRAALAGVQEQLPLDDVVGDVVLLRSGSARAVLEASSVNFALRSEGEQEAILAGYRRFLHSLDYPLQLLVRVVPADVEDRAVKGRSDLRAEFRQKRPAYYDPTLTSFEANRGRAGYDISTDS